MITPTGQALCNDGQDQVLANNQDWQDRFNAVALRHLEEFESVTSTGIIHEIGLPPGNPNAVGAAMAHFARAHHLIIKFYTKSIRTSRRAGRVAVWWRGRD